MKKYKILKYMNNIYIYYITVKILKNKDTE